MADTDSSSSPPLGKYLASTDKNTRDKAIKNLSTFLSVSGNDALPKNELAKLWKGLFYCYWMSDKPLVQQALASELAELLLTITSPDAALAFLGAFWEAIVREWNGIDRLRMDKYYMLVRRFVNSSFRLLIRTRWDGAFIHEYNAILTSRGGPLCPDDNRVPASLTYHVADIYLEELDKVLNSSETNEGSVSVEEPTAAPVLSLLVPFIQLSAHTNSNITYQRIYTSLIEPLLTALGNSSLSPSDQPTKKRPRLTNESSLQNVVGNACLENSKDEGKIEKGVLRKAVLDKIFEIASSPDARESNRRKMYAIWKDAKAEEEDTPRRPEID